MANLSDEARELYLFIDSDADLYRQQYEPIIKNLMKKRAKGIYKPELAEKLFMYLVENGAKKYNKEFGTPGTEWHKVFPMSVRKEVAKELREYFDTEAELGNYDNMIKSSEKIAISIYELEKLVKKDGRNFKIGQKYGQYELWGTDKQGNEYRLEAGSKKDVYNAWVKYRFNEKFASSKINKNEIVKSLVNLAKEIVIAAEGDKCGPEGCIRKVGNWWRVMSGKTGKLWPAKYNTRKEAEDALKRYHGWGFKKK